MHSPFGYRVMLSFCSGFDRILQIRPTGRATGEKAARTHVESGDGSTSTFREHVHQWIHIIQYPSNFMEYHDYPAFAESKVKPYTI